MDAAMLWLTLCSTLAAVASAVFALVQARSATNSQKDAEEARNEAREARDESARLAAEANAAFARQAEAQEEANRIRREELAPADWMVAQVSKNGWRIRNTSGNVLRVNDLEIKPADVRGLVPMTGLHADGRYEPGDAFTVAVVRGFGVQPEKLTIKYHHEDEGEGGARAFHVTF